MVSARTAPPAFVPTELSMLFIPSDLRSGRIVVPGLLLLLLLLLADETSAHQTNRKWKNCKATHSLEESYLI